MRIATLISMSFYLLIPQVGVAGCAYPYVFDANPTFTLKQISKLDATFESDTNPKGTLIVHYFDKEDSPVRVRDGLRAVAIIYADDGGIGDRPVGGVLWSKGPVHHDQTPQSDPIKGNIEYAFAQDDPVKGCESTIFKITFDKNGNLYAGPKKIGSVGE